jgi:hypothetical protein
MEGCFQIYVSLISILGLVADVRRCYCVLHSRGYHSHIIGILVGDDLLQRNENGAMEKGA